MGNFLCWKGETEMPTLSFLTGPWAGSSICGTLQSSSINSLQGIHTSPRATGNTEPLMTGPSPWADLWKLQTSSLHSREILQWWIGSQAKQCGVQEVFLSSAVKRVNCGMAVTGYTNPLSLRCCSKATTMPLQYFHSLSLSINSRPMYWNLKSKGRNYLTSYPDNSAQNPSGWI